MARHVCLKRPDPLGDTCCPSCLRFREAPMCITDIRCLVVSLEQVVINAEYSAVFKRFGKLVIQGCA
jgi:uncharacterized protein (UPF0212 family)